MATKAKNAEKTAKTNESTANEANVAVSKDTPVAETVIAGAIMAIDTIVAKDDQMFVKVVEATDDDKHLLERANPSGIFSKSISGFNRNRTNLGYNFAILNLEHSITPLSIKFDVIKLVKGEEYRDERTGEVYVAGASDTFAREVADGETYFTTRNWDFVLTPQFAQKLQDKAFEMLNKPVTTNTNSVESKPKAKGNYANLLG